jgi:hypothetical protein
VERNVSEYIAFVEQHVAEAGLADANSVLKHGLEHRLQFTGRTRNDAQHFGSGGLLLQCLSSLPSCLGKLPPCLVSVTLCFRKLAGPGFQLLVQSFD